MLIYDIYLKIRFFFIATHTHIYIYDIICSYNLLHCSSISRIFTNGQAAGHHPDFLSVYSNPSSVSTLESDAQNVVQPNMMAIKKLPRDEQSSSVVKLEMNESAPIKHRASKQRGKDYSDNL